MGRELVAGREGLERQLASWREVDKKLILAIIANRFILGPHFGPSGLSDSIAIIAIKQSKQAGHSWHIEQSVQAGQLCH